MGAAFNLLALDTATSVGFAYANVNTAAPLSPTSGTYPLSEGLSMGAYLWWWRDWLWKKIHAWNIQGVIYESPVIIPGATTLPKAMKLCNMAGQIELVCYEAKITYLRDAGAQTVRGHFCGNRFAGKEGVMATCRLIGWKFNTDDEADALATLEYGRALWLKERSET